MNIKRKYSDESLIEAVKTSMSIREVLGKIGKSQQGGGSYYQIKKDFERLDIDTSHFTSYGHLRGKSAIWSIKNNLNEILVENSKYSNRTCLKNRLLKNGLLKNVCYICGQGDSWNSFPLVMVLDHINGKYNDNRIENLRMLCPNCNSQQKTFAGRNKKSNKVPMLCSICGDSISRSSKSKMCCHCSPKFRRRKNVEISIIENKCRYCNKKITENGKSGLCSSCVRQKDRKAVRPSLEILLKEIQETSFSAVGRKYGVSDNAIRKWIKFMKDDSHASVLGIGIQQ